MAQEKIGFIGTGVMGSSMARHVLEAGYEVHVYSRTREKAEVLVRAGARWAGSPRELAGDCSRVITMVGYPSDVEEVYLGPDGLIKNGQPGAIFIDMTTSRPDLAARIWEAAKSRGIGTLDAPVSGGDIGARNATLSIMVGGEEAHFEAAKPLFEKMGKTIQLLGKAGAGQHTKMANQIVVASNLIGAVEAIIYAESAGLDPRRVLDSIGSGAAASWQLSNMVPRMLDGNFEPGFFVKHFVKDLRIALDAAKTMGLDLGLLALAERLFSLLQDRGLGEKGTQALFLLYRQNLEKTAG